ncbi:MAG: YdeI/OmpD-associated family protein, partial [Tepidiformaceae bacterium]
PPMQFRATLHLSGKTSTGIQVPPEFVTALRSGKRPAVTVTIGHHTYRTTIAPMGGDFWIPVSAEQRQAAAITAGDELDIHIELDTAPREVIVPPDLAAALAADPPASAAFEALSYSNKRRIVLALGGAKTAETRVRRLATHLSALRLTPDQS